MLSQVEKTRLIVSRGTAAAKKSQFGQFFTPERTAAFMAGLFPDANGCCRLLDAGAGIGSLSAAFLERWRAGGFCFNRVELDAFEIDRQLHPHLSQTLQQYNAGDSLVVRISGDDYIHAAATPLSEGLFSERHAGYSHAILNPPYKKINTGSAYRRALRRAGIETVNLYSAFVALAVAQAAPGGHIVAIVPRSFCNGPYYRPFRDFILQRAAIRHMHLFEARNKAFKDDDVLQENMIIRLERGAEQGPVTVSTSTDSSFTDLATHEYPFERIVLPDDPAQFIHVPTSPEKGALELLQAVRYTLADLGITVSTGPVVDFRLKEHLRAMPEPGTVPLLYPGHFSSGGAMWPIEGMKKPNAIVRNSQTERWLFPSGFYCVVRRFTAKEEKRRVVASVVDPVVFSGSPVLGFENHMNLFHEKRHGLPQALARGLAVFLNTSAVDESFRCFNGHTQVNATDLKLMKYPSRAALIELGQWAVRQAELTQTMIDARLACLTE